jgi:hypothetical protein
MRVTRENPIFIGSKEASYTAKEIKGKSVVIDNETYFKISNSDEMRPFFMSIVSVSNHWMFIASNGGLTAGRKDNGSSLFPYYTDDKITESADITGSKTIFQIHVQNKTLLWEPFSDRYLGIYKTQRNLYKNSLGNKLIFEEINHDLNLTFRYQWATSEEFGFVKNATLQNNSDAEIKVTLLDGIQNILPYGVSADLQNNRSNLVDAYKKSELEAGVGIFALSSVIVDKAEPAEALKATTVWSAGIEKPTYLLSSRQISNFRRGIALQEERDVKAEKGAYFISATLTLPSKHEKNWMLVADLNQSIAAVVGISDKIKTENITSLVAKDIELGSKNLKELNSASDALQLTADKLKDTRHFANTLFNIMRGGIFDDNYQIEKGDFSKYIQKANKSVYKDKEALLNALPEVFSLDHLKALISKDEDTNFRRLASEYMPLKFSRRHGDPSRPWNRFSINTTSEIDGSKILDYEGNWRDIFQNWEALAHSYPEFIDSMIHKFLNATTFDGYNPYRVTKDGFDWEIIEPDDPWSFIGYWGDHQIVYLLKFLEFIEKYYPSKLATYLEQNLFVYANVPYKIKSYEDILKNPKDTIDFDHAADKMIADRRNAMGADGALLASKNSDIYKVNLVEKLLATVLAKISNFIPEGGIWMNTQRPEWNDANNALVGNGVSMVTLYYLRSFLQFFENLIEKSSENNFEISVELKTFFHELLTAFASNVHVLSGAVSDAERKTIMDGLGIAGSNYRNSIYSQGFSSNRDTLSKEDLLAFFHISKKYVDHTIAANKRADNLYHSYNLMTVDNEKEISISYLSEMLEGQVAVLSADCISSEASLQLLDALKESALFREDQYSYILYPNKDLPRFHDKNNIPLEKAKASDLIQKLNKDGNTQIVERDLLGKYHFNGNFNNADSLKEALSNLPEKYSELVVQDSKLLLDTFEGIFNHKAFTGRSGTFFGYEGLGSIYWHMVSKLLLSVQETCLLAIKNGENEATIRGLMKHYYGINEGIGLHKSPELYGAFPTDPYSHTPAGKGAQQPGMTGQVKEDFLSRFGELGIFVEDGNINFNPQLLRKEEFLETQSVFTYVDLDKSSKEIVLEQGALAFTYCQIPVVYQLSEQEGIQVLFKESSVLEFETLRIDAQTSSKIFRRTGEIQQIIISLKK